MIRRDRSTIYRCVLCPQLVHCLCQVADQGSRAVGCTPDTQVLLSEFRPSLTSGQTQELVAAEGEDLNELDTESCATLSELFGGEDLVSKFPPGLDTPRR